MRFRPSITAKLFLGFLGLLILALGFLGTISTLWFIREQSASLDRFLEAEVSRISNRLEGIVEGLSQNGTLKNEDVRAALGQDLRAYLNQRINRAIPYKTTLLILDDRSMILARSNTALDLTGPLPAVEVGQMVFEDVREKGPAYRVATTSYSLGQDSRGTFRLACLLSSLDGPLASFLTSLLVVLGGSLVLLSFLGAGLINLTLRPVRLMARAAAEIGEQNLGARIPLPPGRDDLSRLALTLNGLLSRLETDYAFQEKLVEDLTHQLKTPLTILRGRNELGLTTRREAGELRELLEDNLSDIDSLVNLLNTLLELARLDGRIDRLKTSPVDLTTLVSALGEELGPLWGSKDLIFTSEGPRVTIEADPEALRQIFTNLFDNAWKFAPQGGRISTHWFRDPGSDRIRIVVANDGPSIPEADRERIFKRFYRGSSDPATPGAGLGLSIVRSLVELHGGRIRAFHPPMGGAAFEIDWPYGSGDR